MTFGAENPELLPGRQITDSTLVDAITQETATILYTAEPHVRQMQLSGLTITNKATYSTTVYAYVGILREADATVTDWEPLVAPYLMGGGSATWHGHMYLGAGDSLAAYASKANIVTVSFGLEDLTP